jgi:hypothetical protein
MSEVILGTMLEELELNGYWWLPSVPEGTVPGTLHVSRADIRLELLGGFAQPATGLESDTPEGDGPRETVLELGSFVADQPRILGQSQNGDQVTLERCSGRSRRLALPRFATSEYGPNIVLIGAWFGPGDEVAFDELEIRFSDLDVWASAPGLATNHVRTSDAGPSLPRPTSMPSNPIEVALDAETTLRIELSPPVVGTRVAPSGTQVLPAPTIKLVFGTRAGLERSLTYVEQLRSFFSLAVGRPVRVLSVHGVENPPNAVVQGPGSVRPPRHGLEVEILDRPVGGLEAAGQELQPEELLFSLADVQPSLQRILVTWFSRQQLLRSVVARYFRLVHTPPATAELELEDLTRVLETHYRRTAGPPPKTAEHQDRLEAILSSTPEKLRRWLEKRLEHSHEPTLSRCLKETLARCPAITSRVIGDKEAQKTFRHQVALAGDDAASLDPPANPDGSAPAADLSALMRRLRALADMTLLLEIGLSCDEVATIFERREVRIGRGDEPRAPASPRS